MMKSNYHTHTYRCRHAVGSEKEMILAAYQSHLKVIGMSEHVPLPHFRIHLMKSMTAIRSIKGLLSMILQFLSNGPTSRMKYKDLNQYLDILTSYQEEFNDQIEIYKGFEAEGIEEYFPYYKSLLDTNQIDYLILGHHYDQYAIYDRYFGRKQLSKKDIYQYCNQVEKALDTKLFSYLAHPDLFLVGYKDFDKDAETVTKRICQKSKDLNIPLEINAGGIRRGKVKRNHTEVYRYPNTFFWRIASEVGNDVIMGVDAHKPSDFDEDMYKELDRFAKEYNLKIIDKLVFLKGK